MTFQKFKFFSSFVKKSKVHKARQRIEQLGASSNGSLHDSEEVAEQLRQQCAAIMAKLKEEKVNQADHQKRHQVTGSSILVIWKKLNFF